MNLLRETKAAIKKSGHAIGDIVFIGSRKSGHCCTWKEYCRLADIEYDNGLGEQQVASDLIVCFRDGGAMWRAERDGAEEWAFAKPFSMPKRRKAIFRLVATPEDVGWVTLGEINKPLRS